MSALAASETPILERLLPGPPDAGYRSHLGQYGRLPQATRKLMLELEASGLTGRGGAAYPTAVKVAAVARKRRTTVIANGTEGEPASVKDKVLLLRNPHLVLDGLLIAGRLVRATEATLAVSEDAERVIAALRRAIGERPADERPRLALVPHGFVSGEESALVSALAGRGSKPTGRRPYQDGILVQNVETLAQLALIARYGADWFRRAGTREEPGTILATVGGAVAEPGVVEIEAGITLGALLSRCGGLAEPVDAVLIGGYFGTWLPADPGTVLSNEALGPRGASLGARAIVALPRAACGLREVARITRYMAGESAGQCGPCVFGLPAVATALEALASGHSTDNVLSQLSRLHAQIARRGACAHPDGMLGFVTSGIAIFVDEVERHRHRECSARRREPVLPLPSPARRNAA